MYEVHKFCFLLFFASCIQPFSPLLSRFRFTVLLRRRKSTAGAPFLHPPAPQLPSFLCSFFRLTISLLLLLLVLICSFLAAAAAAFASQSVSQSEYGVSVRAASAVIKILWKLLHLMDKLQSESFHPMATLRRSIGSPSPPFLPPSPSFYVSIARRSRVRSFVDLLPPIRESCKHFLRHLCRKDFAAPRRLLNAAGRAGS